MTKLKIKAPSYQRYPDKWLSGTRRLSWSTKGIYADLIDTIWIEFQDTCSIPDDDEFICSMLGCDIETWKIAKKEILNRHKPLLLTIPGEKFCGIETTRLFSSGLWKERCKQVERREKLRINGLKGGRPTKTKKNQKVLNQKPKQNQNESLTTTITPTIDSTPTISTDKTKSTTLSDSIESDCAADASLGGGLIKSSQDSPKRKKFIPPTVEQVKEYVSENQFVSVDAEAFVDHYESNGWKVGGKSPMKNWQAAVRNWNRNHKNGTAPGMRSTKPISDRRKTELDHKNGFDWSPPKHRESINAS